MLKDKITKETVYCIGYDDWANSSYEDIDIIMKEYHVLGSHQEHMLRNKLILIPKTDIV